MKKTLIITLILMLLCNIIPLAVQAAAVNYEVSFDKGAPEVTGSVPSAVNLAYGEKYKVPGPGDLARKDHEFTGWKAEGDSHTIKAFVAPFVGEVPEGIPAGHEKEFLNAYAITGSLVRADSYSDYFMRVQAAPSGKTGEGVLTFKNVPPGEYILAINRSGCLPCFALVHVTDDTVNGEVIESNGYTDYALSDSGDDGVFRLFPGETNHDFQIDFADASRINSVLNSSDIFSLPYEEAVLTTGGAFYFDPAGFADFDFNADGVIDELDGEIALSNLFSHITYYQDTIDLAESPDYSAAFFAIANKHYGYTGFTKNSNFTLDKIYKPGDTFNMPGNVKLTAQWRGVDGGSPPPPPPPVTYTVTYAPGEHGTFAHQVTTGLNLGDQTPEAPAVTRERGWRFAGWSPAPTEFVEGDAIYTAQWTSRGEPGGNGGRLTPKDDNTYIEFDENGTPLGEWHWDDDPGEWIYEEYPPLDSYDPPQDNYDLPQTGEGVGVPLLLFMLPVLINLACQLSASSKMCGVCVLPDSQALRK